MSIAERVTRGCAITYRLSREATDWDEATHWSHYNGAFTALLFCVQEGIPVPEALVDSYWQIFEGWGIDPDDFTEEDE